jgi:predicted aspartyl protease
MRIFSLPFLFLLVFIFFAPSNNKVHGQNSTYPGFRVTGYYKHITIPIEVIHNLLIIKLRINGSPELRFILDTGVENTVITEPAILPLINVRKVEGRKVALTGVGEESFIEAGISINNRIDIGNMIEGKYLQLLILPQGLIDFSGVVGQTVYGIIGHDFFRDFIVKIDYGQKKLVLINPKKFKKSLKKYRQLPLKIANGKPYTPIEVVHSNADTTIHEILIDTGSSHALSLDPRLVSVPQHAQHTFLGTGMGGDIYGYLGRVKALNLPNYSFSQVITTYPDTSALKPSFDTSNTWNGIVGGEVLRRFTLIFNYNEGILALKPNAQVKRPFSNNLSGLEVVAQGVNFNQFIIQYIRPNSAAAKAGLQQNDQILSINGTPLTSIGELYYILDKRVGKKCCLTIKQHQTQQQKRIFFVLSDEL